MDYNDQKFFHYSFSFDLGFTLIELLITLAIITILTLAVYPSYSHHLTNIRRTNVTSVLRDISGRIEQFYLKDHSYEGATYDKLGISNTAQTNYQQHYRITLNTTVDSYMLTATPVGTQAQTDKICGTLSLDQQGNKSISGPGTIASCWP